MIPHETLPNEIKQIIKEENLKIYYLSIASLWMLGFLYNKRIAIEENLTLYQKRFCILHEVGHYVCKHLFNQNVFYLWKWFEEKQADQYAIDTLLPVEDLLKEWERYGRDIGMLETIFWVEKDVVKTRLKQIFKDRKCTPKVY